MVEGYAFGALPRCGRHPDNNYSADNFRSMFLIESTESLKPWPMGLWISTASNAQAGTFDHSI